MRFVTREHVGVYLDGIGHRVEDDGDSETRLLDLTLRIQPLAPALASEIGDDVRLLLFGLTDAEPRPSIKRLEFALLVPAQNLHVRLTPELEAGEYVFVDCEITKIRARTQANVQGYALIFRATMATPSARDLEFVNAWLTEQRFITFRGTQPDLFDELARAEATV